MNRPRRLVVVIGTATDVGKTWTVCRLAEHARRDGRRVAARKPVQSFDPADERGTDADQLGRATGESPTEICPPHRWYPAPLAPPMAAELLGRPPIALGDLCAELCWPPDIECGLVETVGGPRSPLAHDGDSAALTHELRPDRVLLVADSGLGAVNAVRLSAGSLESLPVTVVLNRYDPGNEVHRRNRAWLAERDGFDVTVDLAELAGWLC